MEDHQKTFGRISALLDKANSDGVDEFLRAQLAQFICVLASGAIESACQAVLGEHLTKTASIQSARYARRQLGGFMNPNPAKIKDLVATFDPLWAENLESFWDGEIRDAIGSLVSNRHLVSHGKPANVSLAQVKPWVKCAKQFCGHLKAVVEGQHKG